MSSIQQQLAFKLLATGLSAGGYATTVLIMSTENILDRLDGWMALEMVADPVTQCSINYRSLVIQTMSRGAGDSAGITCQCTTRSRRDS
jgi:uncharacterized sodium:solute symporter family permease YidK